MKLKSIVLSVLKEINQKNLNKAMDSFSKGMNEFNKSITAVTREMSQDVAKSNRKSVDNQAKNQANLDKVFGSKKPKIWSDDEKFRL